MLSILVVKDVVRDSFFRCKRTVDVRILVIYLLVPNDGAMMCFVDGTQIEKNHENHCISKTFISITHLNQ